MMDFPGLLSRRGTIGSGLLPDASLVEGGICSCDVDGDVGLQAFETSRGVLACAHPAEVNVSEAQATATDEGNDVLKLSARSLSRYGKLRSCTSLACRQSAPTAHQACKYWPSSVKSALQLQGDSWLQEAQVVQYWAGSCNGGWGCLCWCWLERTSAAYTCQA